MFSDDNQHKQFDTGFFQVYELLFEQFHQSKVRFCLMRDDPELIDSVQEIDILIYPESLDSVVAVLESLNWVLVDTGLFIPLKRAFVKYHNGYLLKVDLHLALVDGPLVYMDAKQMLDDATQTKHLYWLPSNEAWFLHVLLHTILGKKVLDQKYHSRIQHVLSHDFDTAIVQRWLSQYGLADILGDVLANPIVTLTEVSQVKNYRRMARRRLLKDVPGNRIRWFVNALIWPFGQLAGRRRGFVVAIVGPDGAGKSTFLETMKQALKKMEISCRTVYMGPWEYPISPISKWLRTIGASPRDTIQNTDKSVAPLKRYFKLVKGVTKRHLYYINCLLDMWARYFLKIWPQLLLRRVVIADRYVYDLEVGYYNDVLQNSPRLRRTIANMVPKPSFTILLDNSVDVIWNRKKEYPREAIEKSLNMYHEIADSRSFYIVRTDEPVEEIVNSFIENHWVEMMEQRRDGRDGISIAWYEFHAFSNRFLANVK